MVKRLLKDRLLYYSEIFQVISLTGPRQSGKSTLIRSVFGDELPYFNLEDPITRNEIVSDTRSFLNNLNKGAIIDEAQNYPDLFSFIQVVVDEDKTKKFILSGSQNFLLLEKITQSLAGRVAILKLLPFSFIELSNAEIAPDNFYELIYKGCYPAIYDKNILPAELFPSYITTYLERDVRSIKNIPDLSLFQKFIGLCAGRVGQILNLSSLAKDVGLSVNTVKSWLSVLEASYIIYLLQPYYKNMHKRYIRSPKIYFHDVGLASFLLGIKNAEQVKTHAAKGALFENLIINELQKNIFNTADGYKKLFYWRDSNGVELDIILENGTDLIPIEIKSLEKISFDAFNNLNYWKKLKPESKTGYVVYGGNENISFEKGELLGWKKGIMAV